MFGNIAIEHDCGDDTVEEGEDYCEPVDDRGMLCEHAVLTLGHFPAVPLVPRDTAGPVLLPTSGTHYGEHCCQQIDSSGNCDLQAREDYFFKKKFYIF